MRLISREFIKDRFALLLMAFGLLLALVNILNVFLRVEQRDFDIPVRYTQYGSSPIVLGDWYNLYALAFFAIVATTVNFVLALRLHKNRRQLTIALLIGQLLIMIFLFLVSGAILGLPAVS
jgi:hypothetical protein